MKVLPPGMQAHLDGGATTLCNCWKLSRADGVRLGFTDHDRDIVLDDLVCEAAAGLIASAVDSSSGLAVDNLDILGALNSNRLGEGELAAGLFDNAEVEIWRVNWRAPDQRVLMRKGNLGEVSRGANGFTAELRGLAHRLNQPVGRLYQYACDADLGDARCGRDASDVELKGIGTIVECEDRRVLMASGLDAYPEGWFERGRVRFLSGANSGAAMEVKTHALSVAGAGIELWQAMAREIAPGDMCEVTAGCDKQFATCRAKFDNSANFRGFPHMPGNDFVLSYPGAGGANDGGSRR